MTAVRDRLEAVVSAGVPGAVAVAVGQGWRIDEAAGSANVATGEPLTVGHRFRIGSVTKVFVAALAPSGSWRRVCSTSTATRRRSSRASRSASSSTTPRVDDFDVDASFWEPCQRDLSHRWAFGPVDELRLVLEKPRLFPPGEGWAYHGSNYIALRLVLEETAGTGLGAALRQHVFAPLGLRKTELVEGPLQGDCARGYLPADNPIFPGGPGPVDLTEFDVPFHRAGGGIVSTADEVATVLRSLLGGEFLPEALRREMLDTVASDWEETDRYGLGIGEITSVMGRERSPCGAAWGHLGFSVGYVAVALSSEDGERQVVICANGHPSEADEEAFLDAAGRLAWALYCG